MPDWLNIPALREKGQLLFEQAVTIWVSGGWAMVGIAAIAMLMFGLGMHIQLKLRAKGFLSVSEKKWRRWIDHPEQRRGPIGDILDFVTAGQNLKELATFFREIRSTELAPFTRDLRVMKICVSAAPLLGLLGTVMGMLSTFGALATGSGGDQTMDRIAAGISEALVTTETGLIIALPGLFFQYQLTRKYERYKAFLAHLETVCTQHLYHRLHETPTPATATPTTAGAQSAAPAAGQPTPPAPVDSPDASGDPPSPGPAAETTPAQSINRTDVAAEDAAAETTDAETLDAERKQADATIGPATEAPETGSNAPGSDEPSESAESPHAAPPATDQSTHSDTTSSSNATDSAGSSSANPDGPGFTEPTSDQADVDKPSAKAASPSEDAADAERSPTDRQPSDAKDDSSDAPDDAPDDASDDASEDKPNPRRE